MEIVIEMDFEAIKGQEEEFMSSIVEDIAKGIRGDASQIEVASACYLCFDEMPSSGTMRLDLAFVMRVQMRFDDSSIVGTHRYSLFSRDRSLSRCSLARGFAVRKRIWQN